MVEMRKLLLRLAAIASFGTMFYSCDDVKIDKSAFEDLNGDGVIDVYDRNIYVMDALLAIRQGDTLNLEVVNPKFNSENAATFIGREQQLLIEQAENMYKVLLKKFGKEFDTKANYVNDPAWLRVLEIFEKDIMTSPAYNDAVREHFVRHDAPGFRARALSESQIPIKFLLVSINDANGRVKSVLEEQLRTRTDISIKQQKEFIDSENWVVLQGLVKNPIISKEALLHFGTKPPANSYESHKVIDIANYRLEIENYNKPTTLVQEPMR
jgi:hypothetical protein